VQGRDYYRWDGNPDWKVSGTNSPHRDPTIGTYGHIRAIRDLVKTKKLHTAELQFIDHWGKTGDNRIVILDYGVDDGNWKKQVLHPEGQQRGFEKIQGFLYPGSTMHSGPTLDASLSLDERKDRKKMDRKALHSLSAADLFNLASSELQEIGKGGFRTTFKLSPRMVLKIAHKEFGKDQNKVEIDISSRRSFLTTHVYDHAADNSWIIVDLCRPLTSELEFEKLSGIPWETFRRFAHPHTKDLLDKMDMSPEAVSFLRSLRSFVASEKLMHSDVVEIDHWGKTADGRLVLLDYGLRHDLEECIRELLKTL
jgi:hypothetical protein